MLANSAMRWASGLAGGAMICCYPSALAQSSPPSLQVEAAYVSDLFSNLSGGIENGFRAMGKADLHAMLDGAVIGLEGASFHLDLQFVHGDSLSGELVGDAQVVSNIDAPSALRPLEAYVALPFAGGRGVFKTGLIDLNGDFDVQEVGSLFINSSHGIGPDFSQSGLNGPSIFPTTAAAFTLAWEQDGFGIRVGAFDGVSGDPNRPTRTVVRFPGETGLLLVAEADFGLGQAASLQVGGWSYTRRFDALAEFDTSGSPLQIDGNRGVYALAEGTLGEWNGAALDAWVRLGTAESRINPIRSYAGGGMVYGDETRSIGIAVAHAILGNEAIRASAIAGAAADRSETAFELTYSHRISDQLTIQPDIQYIKNPGWDPSLEDAFVAGVRLHISLS